MVHLTKGSIMRRSFIALGIFGGAVATTVAVSRRYVSSAESARTELNEAGFGPIVPIRSTFVRGGPHFVATVLTNRHEVELVRINREWFPIACKTLGTNETLPLSDTQCGARITSRAQLESLMPAYSEPLH